MKRPSIKSPCVADRYHGTGTRIAEFSTPSGKGGLISVHENENGRAVVDVYRVDEGVEITTATTTRLRKELRETLRELDEWDGTPGSFATIKENLRAALYR